MIFETHAHYADERFDGEREELLLSMKSRGVGNIIEVGAGFVSTKQAVQLSKQFDFIYGAVGIHPEDMGRMEEKDIEWLRELAALPKIVAIGEIGLDYHYEEPVPSVQQKWFRRQLELAREVALPVIIHSRDAARDTLEIMQELHAEEIGGVIHCYSYSWEMAKVYLEMGYYLGVGGVVTFKNGRKLQEVVENAPLDRLVLETDSPYLAPEPNRGTRNDSTNLQYVAEKIAELKGTTAEEVIRVTEENARKLYRL